MNQVLFQKSLVVYMNWPVVSLFVCWTMKHGCNVTPGFLPRARPLFPLLLHYCIVVSSEVVYGASSKALRYHSVGVLSSSFFFSFFILSYGYSIHFR
jgi:hypothetical protein